MSSKARTIWPVVLAWLLLAGAGWGQLNAGDANGTRGVTGQIPALRPGEIETPEASDMRAKQMKRLREEHQKQEMSDTLRLLQLATDLEARVEKERKPTLDELKDLDEIGKLAKRVSERIKTQ